MASRSKKQVTIGTIYLVIFGLLIWSVVDLIFISESSCSDGIRNGKEEGVDCGTLACGFACPAAIEELRILDSKIIEVSDNDYDVLVWMANPNGFFGAQKADYLLELKDSTNNTVVSKKGSFYIMPGQTKYVIIPSVKTESRAETVNFKVEAVTWQKLDSENIPAFQIRRNSLSVPKRQGLFAEFEGVIYNDSFFDFTKVEANVIIYDSNNEIVGVAGTDMRTFLSKTERYFRVFWPQSLSSEPVRADIEASTNIFEDSNYIKTQGTQAPFQRYY